MMDARRPDQGPLLLLQRVGRRPGPAPLLGRLVSQRHPQRGGCEPLPRGLLLVRFPPAPPRRVWRIACSRTLRKR